MSRHAWQHQVREKEQMQARQGKEENARRLNVDDERSSLRDCQEHNWNTQTRQGKTRRSKRQALRSCPFGHRVVLGFSPLLTFTDASSSFSSFFSSSFSSSDSLYVIHTHSVAPAAAAAAAVSLLLFQEHAAERVCLDERWSTGGTDAEKRFTHSHTHTCTPAAAVVVLNEAEA